MKRLILPLTLVVGVLLGISTGPAAAAPPSQPFVPGEVLVKYRDGTTVVEQSATRGRFGLAQRERVRAQRNGEASLELSSVPPGADVAATIAQLKTDPNVEYAEPNWVYTHGATSTDTYFSDGSLWGMYGDASTPANQYGSQAAEAWSTGRTGSDNVYVGVIDEGIQHTHPDLDENVWVNPYDAVDGKDNDGNGYVDDVRGWDFANGDNSIYDGGSSGNLDDHGTHVAGTIGAESNNTGVVGVNWNVTLISGKFLGRNGGTTANAVKAVDYFTDLKKRHGLNIVATNNSWGGGGYSQALYEAIERSNEAGILFIAAAGNGDKRGNGINNDATPHYPANYANANIISVAALASNGAKTTWSNYGATSVDIGAPGGGIYSTLAANTYGSYSGTSMATPHVAGAAALYASAKPGATAAQIKAAILGSAAETASLKGITVTGGRLDASAALSK